MPTDRTITVNGRVVVEHKSSVRGSLKAESVRGEGDLEVGGDLSVEDIDLDDGASLEVGGSLSAEDVDVPNELRVKGRMRAEGLRVGGKAVLEGDTELEEGRIGGTLEVVGSIKAEDLSVGGTLKGGSLICEDVNVGGSLKAESVQAEDVEVGGTVEIAGDVKIEDLVVGGTVTVGGGTVEEIRVGGTMKSTGGLTFERINVGGQVLIESGQGGRVTVGGVLEVVKDLLLDDDLEVGGRAKLGGELRADRVSVGGELEADKVTAEDKLSVGIGLGTVRGSKGKEIEIGRRARVKGPIVGDTIKVKERSTVEDVYAETLWMDEGCSANNVYIVRGEIGRDCVVSGHLQYVEDLDLGSDTRLAMPPEKVSTLPGPPI